MTKLKIATFNINSIRSRIEHVTNWLQKEQIDIALLQELKCEEKDFPFEAIEELGYNIALNCQKSYNGVAIFSKYPIEDIKIDFSDNPDNSQARYIEALVAINDSVIKVASIYFPNGGELNSDKFAYKLKFYQAFNQYAEQLLSEELPIFLGGDYNIAHSEHDVYNAKEASNSTCFTDTERNYLRHFFNLSYLDLFRVKYPDRIEFSWWDYRGGSFKHNKGLRIDYIAASPKAADLVNDCYIDLKEREKAKASDHAPVIAELNI